jgi:hypothetical protein
MRILPNALSDSIATSVKSILITDKIVFKIQNDFINECVFLIKELFHVVRVVFFLFAYVNSYQKKNIINIFSLSFLLITILSVIKMDFTEVAMLSERAFGKTVAVFAVLDNNGT